MERTSHFGLPIFEADDHPSILTDFNQAMYDIDNAMFTISMGGSASAEAIEELRQGLTSVSTQISAINQTLGTKLDDTFLNNLAPKFDPAEHYNKYNFVFKNGSLYQCIDDYDPANGSFDNCFVTVWLCNNVASNQSDIESLNGSVSRLDSEYSSLDGRVTILENTPPTPPIATKSTLGVVKVGGGLAINSSGDLTPDNGLGISVYDSKLTISANNSSKTVDFYSANGVTTSTNLKYRMYTRFIPAMRTSTGGIGSHQYVLDAIGTVYSTDSIAYELKNGFVINTTFFDNALTYEYYMGTAELYDANNQQSLSYRIIPSRKNGGRAEFIPITDAKSGSVTALTTDTLGDTGKLRLSVHIIRGTRDSF